MRRTNPIIPEEEEEEEEVVPIAVTLRNAFAPKQQLTADAATTTSNSSNNSINRIRSNRTSLNTNILNNSRPAGAADNNQNQGNANLDLLDAENDIGSNNDSDSGSDSGSDSDSLLGSNGSSFPYLSRLSLDQSNLPLEMELVVPHSLLVELKHSYQNFAKMKEKISEKFGLGKMDHKGIRSGRNNNDLDADIHRLVPVCTMPVYDSSRLTGSDCRERIHGGLDMQDKSFSTIVMGTGNHPLWDHIHERIEDLYNEVIAPPHLTQHQHQEKETEKEQSRRERIWKDIRNCMRIQCKAILVSDTIEQKHAHEHAAKAEIILTSASLNPKNLKLLPIQANTITSEDPSILGVSKYTNAIPCALPRNSLMIHFSDGSTRVLPALFSFLVKKGVLPNTQSDGSNGSSRNGSIQDGQVDKFEKRFDDDIFNVLTDTSKTRTVNFNLGSCAPVVNGNYQHGNGTGNDNGKSHGNGNGTYHGNGTVGGSFTEAFNSLSIRSSIIAPSKDGDIIHKSMELSDDDAESDESPNYVHTVDDFMGDFRGHRRNSNATVSSGEKDSCDVIKLIQDMDEEIESLQQILEEEEKALEKEKKSQQVQLGFLQDFIAEVNGIEKEIIEIDEEANFVSNDCVVVESELCSKRRALLKELKESIFPIRTGDVFTINGMPLPKDMHSLTASDEIISAGLGFVCLVVIMCSKYLSIPLRHRLIFNSSRSAVRENFDVFPLFKERVVEKEQFDRGIVLLHRNIDHLLHMGGVPISARRERTHILAKLELLLDHIK